MNQPSLVPASFSWARVHPHEKRALQKRTAPLWFTPKKPTYGFHMFSNRLEDLFSLKQFFLSLSARFALSSPLSPFFPLHFYSLTSSSANKPPLSSFPLQKTQMGH